MGASAFTYRQLQPTDFFLPKDAESGSPFAYIQAWGYDSGVFYTVIKTDKLASDKKLKNIILIVRLPFSDRDRMTDTAIIKSQIYTIIDGFMNFAVPILGHDNFKVILNKFTPITDYVAEIPFMFSAEDIKSLSDVERIGGKIIAQVGGGTTFMSAPPPIPAPSPPSDTSTLCPPNPATRTMPKKA